MSETTRLMSFEEFRAAGGEHAEAVRQQQEFFRDDAAADEIRRQGGISMATWPNWENRVSAVIPVAG